NLNGTADNFRFVYQTLSNDGEIKVRINSVANSGTGARAGVMIRESLTTGSEYAFIGISPDGAFRWQRRSNTGGNSFSAISTIGAPPDAWVRLARAGGSFYGFKSYDGINWTLIASRRISMTSNIYVGLAVASGLSDTLNTSTFTSVTVVP